MRKVILSYENKEFEKIERAKERSGENWERFILMLLRKYEEIKK